MGRKILLMAVVAVTLGGVGVLAPKVGAATSASLSLPQATAFATLGHSCGGINEQVFSTGFDPNSGYPTGDVYLQTRCGGSGRGGGYHTTTYSAWTTVTWDFTTAVMSWSVLSAAPSSLDPGFTATDPSGNQVANALTAVNVLPANCTVGNTTYCTYRATLTLASGFSPVPRVTGLSLSAGPAAGGTVVTISGTGFTGATGVSFGGAPAAAFTVDSDTSITATTPQTSGGAVDVTVTTAGGSSGVGATDQFTFVDAPVVTAVSPGTGSVDGGTSVTISGTHLSGTTAVTFGDVGASFTVIGDTSVVAVSPVADAADSVAVTVTSLGGVSSTSPATQFMYTAGIQCAKLSGTLTGTETLSKCTPGSAATKSASVAPTGLLIWSPSGVTTQLVLDAPVLAGQGGCPAGRLEYDISGTVTGGTSTATAAGDPVSARTCVSRSGKVSLVKGTTYSL